MRYIVILLLGFVATLVFCRPPIVNKAEDSDREDAEYENGGDDTKAEDSLQDDSELSFGDQEAVEDEQEEPSQNQRLREPNGNKYSRRISEDNSARSNSDKFPGYKINSNSDSEEETDDELNSDSQYRSSAQQREINRYTGKSDGQQDTIQLSRRHDDTLKSLRPPVSRTSSNEESELLFESNPDHNNKIAVTRDLGQLSKNYYNSLQGVLGDKRYGNRNLNLNRDRRAAQDINETSKSTSINNFEIDNNTEDEEAAIKKHVKKLSEEELKELLNSLSEDKKDLLKKIMENDSENEITKREITKKASAAPDENGSLESGLSEASKLQEENCGSEPNPQTPSTILTVTSKQSNPQSDINTLPVTKTLEANNGSPLTDNTENKADNSINTIAPLLDSNNQAKIDANVQTPTRTEIKREANPEDTANIDSSFDETNSDIKDSQKLSKSNEPGMQDFCAQDEDLLQFTDNESQFKNDNNNILKREALIEKNADFSESIKSLEESFPNSNSYEGDDPYLGSEMAPLVRVKRKNLGLAVKKRSAGIMPDAKVAYFPYGAENDDEDNDEGNEFDDDGFFDHTSNLAKLGNKDNLPSEEESSVNFENAKQQLIRTNKSPKTNVISRSKLTQVNDIETDTMNLGSDTDSVLSGVEGVDDNLMYNSGSRSRRTIVDTANVGELAVDNTDKSNGPMRSTPFSEDVTLINNVAPNYHENDAFGPLPRNYEGELSRYKRIRRVKQLSASKDMNSDG